MAAQSAPPVLCLMSRSQHLQPSYPTPFPTIKTHHPVPACLRRCTLLPTSYGVSGRLCLCVWSPGVNSSFVRHSVPVVKVGERWVLI